MKRFIVVVLASLFVVGLLVHFFPGIASVAFTVPTHRLDSGSVVGGWGITWTMLLFGASLIGLGKLAAK